MTSVILRAWGGAIATLALALATVVAWVAWYLADAVWSAAPLSASRTPVPGVVFTGAVTTAVLVTVVGGVLVGATVERGVWVPVDPTRVLPLARARRLLAAWGASIAVAAVATVSVLPVYFAIAAAGGVTPALAFRALATHAAALLVAPLVGLAVARFRVRHADLASFRAIGAAQR